MEREDAEKRDITLAWMVAALSRQEKLPPLKNLLRVPGRRQTRAEQRQVLYMLSRQYGIPIRQKALTDGE